MRAAPPSAVDVDANATRPVGAAARQAYMDAAALTGPQAEAAIEAARVGVAAALHARPDEVVWTQGGSDADAQALWAGCQVAAAQPATLLLSVLEHRASRQAAQALAQAGRARVVWLPADGSGRIDVSAAPAVLAGQRPALVSVLLAHNETGVLQPIDALRGALQLSADALHLDAVQALGRLPLSFHDSGAGMMSVAGHKVGSVGGIGALLVRAGTPVHRRFVAPCGGAWAGGFAYAEGARGASAALCASFAAAVRDIDQHVAAEQALAPLRDEFERALQVALAARGVDVSFIGAQAPRLPNTSLVHLAGIEAEGALMALDVAGYAASSGAACSAGAIEPSTSLIAMGFGRDAAKEVLRFSLRAPAHGMVDLPAQLQQLVTTLADVAARMRQS